MKFLVVVFVIIVVVQLADVAADKLSFNDMIETYGEQENLENNQVKIATEDMNSLLRRRNCKTWCLSICRNRIADIILSFTDPIEAYEEQQNIKDNKLRSTSEDMTSLSRRRKCFSACLTRCRRS